MEEFSVIDILKKFSEQFKLLLASMLIGILVAGGVMCFVPSKYASDSQLIVQSVQTSNEDLSLQSDITGNVLLINTYKDMIMGDLVIDEVKKSLNEQGYVFSNLELKNMISVEQSENSQIFKIKATSEVPKLSAIVSSTTANIFKNKVDEILKGSKVSITSKAQLPTVPIAPNKKNFLVLGAILGLVLGMVGILILEYMDKTVKNEEFIAEKLGLSLLGTITEINLNEKQKKLQKMKHGEENIESRMSRNKEARLKRRPRIKL